MIMGRVLICTVLTCKCSYPKLIFWVEFLERDVGVLWWEKAGKLDSDL